MGTESLLVCLSNVNLNIDGACERFLSGEREGTERSIASLSSRMAGACARETAHSRAAFRIRTSASGALATFDDCAMSEGGAD